MLVLLFSIIAVIVGLIALVRGRMRWARIPNRARAGVFTGSAVGLLIVSFVVFGVTSSDTTTEPTPTAMQSAKPTQAPDLASYVGKSCDADHLVMTQGENSNYCDEDADGALVWVGQGSHDKAEAQAKAAAEKKAAKKAKASEEAEAKRAAEAQAKQDAADKKAKAKADKAAAEKKAAQKAKASEEAEAKRAAEAQAKQEAADRKAAEVRKQKAAEQPVPKKSTPARTGGSSGTFYKNCTAVRAAGADPIYAGQPGYSRKLDRDGDGVGCE
ncbi:excalibur calcium-binding domain-containing protein [Arthrobacter rhombi]|uniref:excalibur calcium-binding domain-containing protein n=1 Tax=Arthrobacter rhombi TaxID=71253 RepID=UPI003FD528BA